jgi:hypothetical protein
MVQERDFQPRKIHHADLDRTKDDRVVEPSRPQIVSPPSQEHRVITDMASGLALLLSLIAFFLSSFAVIQAVSTRRQIESLQTPRGTVPGTTFEPQSDRTPSRSFAEPISRPLFPLAVPYRFETIEPGAFIQPVLAGAGQVELLSATRDANSNLVNVQMRVWRLPNSLERPELVNLSNTIALNTRTNQRFVTQDSPATRNTSVLLDQLRPGQTIDATITLQIPTTVDRVDLEIPETRAFRNVPIS